MKGLAAVLLVASASVARADEAADPVVIVASSDAAFVAALEDLVVFQVRAIGDVPVPALGELAAQSRRLADTRRGSATVWLTPATTGATLVVYDRTADRFLVRELAYALPLTATQAAEAARMARTMLRALRAPDDEAAIAASVRVPPPMSPREPSPRVAATFGAGAWFGAPESTATPHVSLSIAWRPHGLGAALTATVAPSAQLATGGFAGSVRDTLLALEARYALRIAPAVRVAPSLGVALHLLALDGTFAGGPMVDSSRVDPAIRGGAILTVALSRVLDVGLAVSADCLLVRQRYEAGSERILLVPRVHVLATPFVGIRL